MGYPHKNNKTRGQIDVFDEIIVDSFADGGASTGIELATGRVPQYRIAVKKAGVKLSFTPAFYFFMAHPAP